MGKEDLPSTKLYKGRKYYLYDIDITKRDALRVAAKLRRKGYNARIYIGRVLMGVYSSPKPPHWYSSFILKKRKP